jgi:hypothetical protein
MGEDIAATIAYALTGMRLYVAHHVGSVPCRTRASSTNSVVTAARPREDLDRFVRGSP